jgi:hypothetical protein
MLETGVEDEHIALINNQMEFGATIGMVPPLIPYTKWSWLPFPWFQRLQAGRERLKEVSLEMMVCLKCFSVTNKKKTAHSFPSGTANGTGQ